MWAKQSSLFSVWNWSLHSWLRSGPSRQKCRQNVLPKCAPESTMCHWSTETQTQLCCSAQISNGFIWQKRSSLGQRSMTVFVAVSLGVRCYVLGEVRAWAVNWSPPGSDLNQMAETALCAAVCAAPDLLRTSWSKNHFQLSPRSKLSPRTPAVREAVKLQKEAIQALGWHWRAPDWEDRFSQAKKLV